jgi:hypothetical protein
LKNRYGRIVNFQLPIKREFGDFSIKTLQQPLFHGMIFEITHQRPLLGEAGDSR